MANLKLGRNGRSGQKRVGDFQRIANTRILTRVLTYLYENEWSLKTNISIGISASNAINDALNWLCNHKLVIKRFKTYKTVVEYNLSDEQWRIMHGERG